MRSTVTLDPDVEALLRNRMRERGITFKQALNQALREALSADAAGAARRYELKTYHMGFPPEVALGKALSLAAAVEDEDVARRLSLRQ